jgi:hypothetical protein
MIRCSILGCIFPALVIASPAVADPVGAELCAKSLSPAALKIYRAAAPDLKPNSSMEAVLRSAVIPMVMSGDMTRSTARPAAMAASYCLRTLQQPAEQIAASNTPTLKPVQTAAGSDEMVR